MDKINPAKVVVSDSVADKRNKDFEIKTSQQMASACAGGLITSLFMTPLDVVKTRLQAQEKSFISNKCFLYCNGLMDHLCPCHPDFRTKPTGHLNGTIDALVKISRIEGLSSLWSGLSPTLALALPATVIYFVAYEKLRGEYLGLYRTKINTSADENVPILVPILAGSSARILSCTIVSPLELIRTKMQSEKLSYFHLYETIKRTVHSQGVIGLWRGLPSTIYRDVPFSGIYWSSYELLKSKFLKDDHVTFAFSFCAGAISGSLAALITTPFDVVKTHMQIEFGEKVIYTDKPAKNFPSETTFTVFKRIFVTRGIKGLYAGVGPRLAKVAPACAIMIASFEYGKHFFYERNKRKFEEI